MNKTKFYMFTTFILLFVLLSVLVYHFKPAAKIKANAPSGYISWELQTGGPYSQVPFTGQQDQHMADINGDSMIDMLDVEESRVYINPGGNIFNGFSQKYSDSLATLPLFRPDKYNMAGIRVVDINNDGLSDIFQSYFGNGKSFQAVYINTGDGWQKDTRYTIPVYFASDTPQPHEHNAHFADLNSDDLSDIIDNESSGKIYLATPQN